MQNERHFRLSTWDVIMQHDDFVRVPELPVTRPISTRFREVQQAEKKGKRFVFVLDASVSMDVSYHTRLPIITIMTGQRVNPTQPQPE
ncbi:hypothetical protein ISCGN_007888 [Ixodes scapularis]